MEIKTQSLIEADTETRYKQAVKDARAAAKAAGVPIKIRQNVMTCCRGCTSNEDLGLPKDDDSTAYAYTFGGQGNRIQWRKGNPVFGARKPKGYGYMESASLETKAYWNHGNGSAPFLKEAFEANGFEVEWDGSDAQCVIVNFPEALRTHLLWAVDVEGRTIWSRSHYGALDKAGLGYDFVNDVKRFTWIGADPDKDEASVEAAAVEELSKHQILANA